MTSFSMPGFPIKESAQARFADPGPCWIGFNTQSLLLGPGGKYNLLSKEADSQLGLPKNLNSGPEINV